MSSQKSELPIRTNSSSNPSEHPRNDSHQGIPAKDDTQAIIDLDPFASPAEYYGQSHAPRKVAKSRTFSAVGVKRRAGARLTTTDRPP